MESALIAMAAKAGMPMIRDMLSAKFGGAGGLAADVIEKIAQRAGITPADIPATIEKDPGRVLDAMREVEKMTPELIGLYTSGLEYQMAALKAEETEPFWARAWRPGWMYLLGLFWVWNIMILHVANAIWKIALPPAPWDVLMSLTGVFMALYMGGHTLKDVAARWGEK